MYTDKMRCLPLTFRAFSYVSSRASANHSSTERGQHSTALVSMIRASSTFSISTANFHSRTDVGICSRAGRKERHFNTLSLDTSTICHQLTLSEDLLFGCSLRLQLYGFHPDLHRLGNMSNGLSHHSLGLVGGLGGREF